MERYHRACGNGLEMQAQLSETDFFDSQSTDPEQRDNFGVEDGKDSGVGEKAEILFGREFRRTIRDNLRNSNHPATISIVIDFLHHCLNRLKKGDLEAHNAIQEFLNSGEKNPPEIDPFGLLLSDALRLLRACVANKLISDPAGPSRGE